MSVLLPFAVKCAFEEPMVEQVLPHMQIAPESCILELDLKTCKASDACVNAHFTTQSQQLAHVHGFFVWFDVLFAGPTRQVTLSTAPGVGYTHWRHTILYLDEPVSVEQDTPIQGTIVANPDTANRRFVNIDLTCRIGASREVKKHFAMK